ncbi:helix-turn-helix domain-containing protein [Pararhizobium arenae]|uniref:helix-turn-helix domain-containing protein n=1 Tax=Pararhizobium arenae TaxID=1856850 RepID=UPI00094B06CA|nr:helix-turn-helix transcriptional regulator [Pararhizobium arenae]
MRSTQFTNLRRLRRLHGIKQEHMAELLQVSQPTLSRLERGLIELKPAQAALIERHFAKPSAQVDRALARLVDHTTLSTHLIEDRSHKLLAASPARWQEWRLDRNDLLGASLRPFATSDIELVEQTLNDRGWFDDLVGEVSFVTADNGNIDLPIRQSSVCWERVCLADGTTCRLVTTLPE